VARDHDTSESAPFDATLAGTLDAGLDTVKSFGPYRVGGRIGAGGMGVVYSAQTDAGTRVAIKRLHRELADAKSRARFLREADILETLDHPALVRHVAHGSTDDGDPYLVMEWLDGEDLAQRLRRGSLSVEQAVALGRQLASGLAAAHAAGVLHRDVKPTNIFLPDGELERAKIIDFGVAHWRLATRALTRTGGIVGTPGYMSPEQARGEADVDERTDIYSLGCVLYEGLAGQPPFQAKHAIAMLAKILLEDAQPLSELRPDVPARLVAAIAEMMQRNKGERLTTMGDVEAALASIHGFVEHEAVTQTQPRPSVSWRERRLLTVIVASGAPLAMRHVEGIAQRHGGRALGLIRDAHIVVFEAGDSPLDVSARAARCAQELHSLGGGAKLAIVSGRAELTGRSIVGQILELGAELIESICAGEIAIDDTTSELLDERFEVDRDRPIARLGGFDETRVSAQRTVLGRPTPFVGRVRELGQLRGVVEAAIEDEAACAILVTADPGIGKSRLRHELLTGLIRDDHDLRVLLGRGDAVSARVPLGLIARALRTHVGIVAGESEVRQRAKVRAALPTDLDRDPETVALFLCELAGIPPQEPVSAVLEAARRDPNRMRESIHFAWSSWMRAEAKRRVVILVLEDLHWADEATLALVEHTLTELRERPLIVLALARPEIDERFGEFWTTHDLTRLELRPLSVRACETLVGEVAGDRWRGDLAKRVVALAGGNAFYLEELIRIVAARDESSDDFELPESILATARARLARLDDQARRLLRAAAVLGERFWSGALQALLADRTPQQIQASVDVVIANEHVIARPTSSIAGNREFMFCHALVRDAAYASLTPEDRRLAHHLAAQWLEARAASEASVLADHHRLAGNHAEAASWYARAGRQSLDSKDFADALELVARGLELADESHRRGELLGLQVRALVQLGRYESAVAAARGGLDVLVHGSNGYWKLQAQLAEALGRLGRFDDVAELLERALVNQPTERADFQPWVRACFRAAQHIAKGRGFKAASPYAERLRRLIDPEAADAATRLQLLLLEHELADGRGDLGTCYRLNVALRALDIEIYGEIEGRATGADGHILAQLGLNKLAEADLRAWFDFAEPRGMQHASFVAAGMLGGLALRRGAWDEAADWFDRADKFEPTDPRMLGPVAGFRAYVARQHGELEEALELARRSELLLRAARPLHPFGLAVLASIQLARGETSDALAHARAGIAIWDELEGMSEFEAAVHVALLECLLAVGAREEACQRAAQFRLRLRQRCAWIDDPALERTFILRVPDNARLVELCDELLGADR
jgi:tetratricopeptide (TPR) repeat protein